MAKFKCQKSYHFLTDGQELTAPHAAFGGFWFVITSDKILKDKQNDHHF